MVCIMIVFIGLPYFFNKNVPAVPIINESIRETTRAADDPASQNVLKQTVRHPRPEKIERDEVTSIWKYKNEFENTLKESEFQRSKLLGHLAADDYDMYLWGVSPISTSEAKAIQAKIAELQPKVPTGELQSFDEWLQETIIDYDAFGIHGKRVVHILVPKKPSAKHRVFGMIYSVTDFEAAKLNFEKKSPRGDFHKPTTLLNSEISGTRNACVHCDG